MFTRRSTQNAMDCLQSMKENHTYHGEKIGVVKYDIPGMVSSGYRKGDIVIFREADYEKGTLVVERPMTQEAIKEQRDKGSLLTTVGTTVSVPINFVGEVKHLKIRRLLESLCSID